LQITLWRPSERKSPGAYQKVVPNLIGKVDQQFGEDLAAAKAGTAILPSARQKQFKQIIDDVFTNRMENTDVGSVISGQNLKDAESRLTMLAKQYTNSSDADQKILGSTLFDVRQALRDMAARSDPESGGQLQAINQGWAKLKQMAASADQNGIITPGRLVRQANKTGYDTDLARAASKLLPDQVPNSGTADRQAVLKLVGDALTGGSLGGTALATGHLPIAAGAAGLAIAPYTQRGQQLLNAFAFAERPKAVQSAAKLANVFAKAAPAITPALLAQKGSK
jgi:hypothetical protein